jgi:hypothetical protein
MVCNTTMTTVRKYGTKEMAKKWGEGGRGPRFGQHGGLRVQIVIITLL